ncbi:MAG TPA: cation diffusion facilitator family transporter [Blastocatellia bacterium]|nr:cation diffusion facilitator family transporter [Blastocatellia bacterium]
MVSHAHQHSHSDHAHHHARPHTHGSAHHHDHARGASQRTLLIVLALTFTYMLAEAIGGYLANSLALLSDAGHMLTDVAALMLSLFAVRFASRPATPSKTYGFYRLEILAALANGVTLIVLSLLILVEAYDRLRHPEAVAGWTLIWISTGGLAVNLISAWLLSRFHDENLNIRGALLHVLGDLFGSVAAIAAGVMIIWRGWAWADPLFSVAISVLIIYSSWRLVADAVNVLLEGTPSHINAASVEEAVRTVTGVRAVHDLHIWTITSGRHAVTAHVVINDASESYRILREVREMLAERFALTHSTIQVEDPTFDTVVNFKKKD